MTLPESLRQRFQRLFRFMDRNQDGRLDYQADLLVVAKMFAGRKYAEGTPEYEALFQLLAQTYAWENSRRDLNHDGHVTPEEFVESHAGVVQMMVTNPEAGLAFIAKAAGGFFDILDTDGDGFLSVTDVEDYAAAYGKSGAWVATNFQQLIASSTTAAQGMAKAEFLELVRQYWFDPDDTQAGAKLFGDPAVTDW